MFGVLVPEMERAVAACRAECAMDGVERDVVDAIDVADIALVGRGDPMAFEGEIEGSVFSSTYCIAHRPSTLPTAKPLDSLKQEITRVCHFRGDCIVL